MLKTTTQQEIWSIQVGDNCVACGACAEVCPTEALVFEDDDVTVRLELHPTECTHCEICLSACAIDALSLDFGSASARIVATSEWVQCKRCGEAMATRAEMDAIRSCLAGDFPPALLEFTTSYCPDCKYKEAHMPKGH